MSRNTITRHFFLILFCAATVSPMGNSCGRRDPELSIRPPLLAHFHIESVLFSETLLEGQPLELTFCVKLPDDEAWISAANKEKDRGLMHMTVRIRSLDEEDGLYRLDLSQIPIPWPSQEWELSDLNSPPFTDFEWRFPDDFQVSGLYANGEQFEGNPLLPIGTYELYIITGEPPVGSNSYDVGGFYSIYFGTFEVVPAESAE